MNEVKETSGLSLHESTDGKILEVQVTGKITAADYDHFVPAIEKLIEQHGKIRVLMNMHDFHGWTAGALWEDIKFDARHFRDIERIAMVGESKWQKAMTALCKPFTTAIVRYYEHDQIDNARAWLLSE